MLNCTKIIPPSPSFINFFCVYSYFTLVFSLIITPLEFYIILTKSKNLKSFKILIFNHTFWCIFFEICFTSVKPLFLAPAISGYPLGVLKDGNLKITAFATYSILFILISSLGALESTLACRYLLVFPATNWFSAKHGIAGIFIQQCFAYGAITYLFYPFIFKETLEFYDMAISYDPCLIKYFLSEPGFLFISHKISGKILYICFSMLSIVLFLSLILAAFFIFLIKTNITTTTIKFGKSLMISAIIQLSITIIFNFIPVIGFLGILAFEIPNTQNLLIIFWCLLESHSCLESLATLYFVTPYRKAVLEILNQTNFLKKFSFKNCVQSYAVSNNNNNNVIVYT